MLVCGCCRERPKLTESDVAMDFAARLGRPILRVPDQEQVSMFDTLVESIASPRTRKLLQEYQHLAKVCMMMAALAVAAGRFADLCRF